MALNLLDLNHDILHLIVTILRSENPRFLLPLATVSKACYRTVLPQLFYSVHLRDRDLACLGEMLYIPNPIKARLADENDNLRDLVHELTILNGGNHHMTSNVHEEELRKVLDCIVSLYSFSWETEKELDPSFIQYLESLKSRWPKLKVSVSRQDLFCNTSTEKHEKLLASPIVNSLCLNFAGRLYNINDESNMLEMSRIITQSTTMEKLSLDIDRPRQPARLSSRRQSATRSSPLPETPLSNLLSLRLSKHEYYPGYSLDLPNSELESRTFLTRTLLTEAPKWTHVRELELCGLEPSYTIRNLKYRIPNLEYLELVHGDSNGKRNSYLSPLGNRIIIDEDSDALYFAESFVSHLYELQELRIINNCPVIKSMCLAILELRVLGALSFLNIPDLESASHEVFPTGRERSFVTPDTTRPINTTIFEAEFLRKMQKFDMQHLQLDAELEDLAFHCINISPKAVLRTDSLIQVLTEFKTLRTLTLCVNIPTFSHFTSALSSIQYKEGSLWSPLVFHEEKAKRVVEVLFRKLHNGGNGNGQLREVEVCFICVHERWEDSEAYPWHICVKATRLYDPYVVGKEVRVKVEKSPDWSENLVY